MLAYTDLLIRFTINLIAVVVFMFGFYYRRHQQKETVIAATLFNTFAFAVLSVLSSAQFGVKVGFGLFAVLALFTLRSEPIKRIDISYFFGCLAIATLTSLQALSISYVLLLLCLILIATYIIDHPFTLQSANQIRVTLDTIPDGVTSSPQKLEDYVAKQLGVKVLSIRVISIDYVTDIAKIEVNYQINNNAT